MNLFHKIVKRRQILKLENSQFFWSPFWNFPPQLSCMFASRSGIFFCRLHNYKKISNIYIFVYLFRLEEFKMKRSEVVTASTTEYTIRSPHKMTPALQVDYVLPVLRIRILNLHYKKRSRPWTSNISLRLTETFKKVECQIFFFF